MNGTIERMFLLKKAKNTLGDNLFELLSEKKELEFFHAFLHNMIHIKFPNVIHSDM